MSRPQTGQGQERAVLPSLAQAAGPESGRCYNCPAPELQMAGNFGSAAAVVVELAERDVQLVVLTVGKKTARAPSSCLRQGCYCCTGHPESRRRTYTLQQSSGCGQQWASHILKSPAPGRRNCSEASG